MSILRRRLNRAVALLGLARLVVLAMALTRVGGVMIVVVRMAFCCREREPFKEMMDAVRWRRCEKKHEQGSDPKGATGT
jgi:hypothetical protein